MAVKKNATEAAEAAEKEKAVNNTTKGKEADSGADSAATEGKEKEGEAGRLHI